MITTVVFSSDCRVFKIGDTFSFRPGMNFLVGDQGCGKSTLLEQLAITTKCKTYHGNLNRAIEVGCSAPLRPAYFDFEKHNPRTQPAFDMGYGYGTQTQISSMFMSHGEFVLAYTNTLSEIPTDVPALFLLDEPDAALSPRSAYQLVKGLEAVVVRGFHVIASVHNPILIESQPEVLSVEHRRWMPSKEFLELMRTTPSPKAAEDKPSPKKKR